MYRSKININSALVLFFATYFPIQNTKQKIKYLKRVEEKRICAKKQTKTKQQ